MFLFGIRHFVATVKAGDIFCAVNGINVNVRRMTFCTNMLIFGTGCMDHGTKNGGGGI